MGGDLTWDMADTVGAPAPVARGGNMNAYSPLGRETATGRQALMVLQEEHPDFTEEDIHLVLDSESNLKDAIGHAVRQVLERQALADAALALARQYKDRGERHKAAVERGRARIVEALETVGLRKMTLPEATISIGRGQPSVLVTDEELVPVKYRRADPRIEAAYEQLLRAAAFAAHHDCAEMQADFLGTADALLAHFSLDRKAIAAALKDGGQVAGATLGNGATWLTVRVG